MKLNIQLRVDDLPQFFIANGHIYISQELLGCFQSDDAIKYHINESRLHSSWGYKSDVHGYRYNIIPESQCHDELLDELRNLLTITGLPYYSKNQDTAFMEVEVLDEN